MTAYFNVLRAAAGENPWGHGCAGCGQSTYGQRHGACERCEGGYDDEEDYPRD